MTWQGSVKTLSQQPHLHARFLNTLSFLEYIGARKIMKSQEESLVTPSVLAHATEEIRHAQIIKKLALKVGAKSVYTYQPEALLCGDEAKAYIHGIDYKAQAVLGEKDSWRNYLLTTLVVEERAQELYPYYDEVLSAIGLGGPLKTIVREEVGHLEEVVEKLKVAGQVSEDMIHQVRQEEQKLYNQFFQAIDKIIQKEVPESIHI
jgi:CRISPR/Cas system-associated endonuclease Cas3-HD